MPDDQAAGEPLKGKVGHHDLPAGGGYLYRCSCGYEGTAMPEVDEHQGHDLEATPLVEREAPPAGAMAPLEGQEYGAVRASCLGLARAIGPVPLELLDRLIFTAERGLEASTAELVLNGGMTKEQADESKAILELEVRLFRATRTYRQVVETISNEGRAKASQAPAIEVPGNGRAGDR